LLDHIDRVVYANDRVALYGSVPVDLPSSETPQQPGDRTTRIDFCAEGALSRKPQVGNRIPRSAAQARTDHSRVEALVERGR